MDDETRKAARILIVDDESANVRLLERVLEREGYTNLKSTTDARQALPLYTEFRPDLVLLDLAMPYLDGFQVLERIKPLISSQTFLPILVLTADISFGSRTFSRPGCSIRSLRVTTRASSRPCASAPSGSFKPRSWRRWVGSWRVSPTS